MAGLHCGSQRSPADDGNEACVVPVLVAGLHCGSSGLYPAPASLSVVPVLVAGLHCGALVDEDGLPPTDNGWVVKALIADPAGNHISLIQDKPAAGR